MIHWAQQAQLWETLASTIEAGCRRIVRWRWPLKRPVARLVDGRDEPQRRWRSVHRCPKRYLLPVKTPSRARSYARANNQATAGCWRGNLVSRIVCVFVCVMISLDA